MQDKGKTLLTGIKPTGTPHVGNYLGAIKPAIEMVRDYEKSFLFIADYHALNTVQDGRKLHDLTMSIAATWLACGLDPSKTVLYRQSAVPEVFELDTILNSLTPKGWMNKAHAYKAAVDVNVEAGKDRDDGVSMGLYTYPILMAADIILYDGNVVPVGKDQLQHVEIARDIAQKFNHVYDTQILTLPEALIQEDMMSVTGIDGRKMSKSYDNILPLFASSEEWKKHINKIPTDSSSVEDPKDTSNSILFDIFRSVATPEQTTEVQARLEAGGMGWGDLKKLLVEVLETEFGPYRERYDYLMSHPEEIQKVLDDGAKRAHQVASQKMIEVRRVIGA